ncbi:glyoxalase [Bacillus suaedae]|uniref:Glyoxalase n=1 Tax=Halalkalibacter suaedae TaxID=2822140 RepID=A0A940WYD9_9BACI|nr:glyoxalase [Bacillus suaedae]MBP3950751.1 glyoxalase [Bacillus suaedae]
MGFELKAIDHVQLAAPKASEDTARQFFVEVLEFNEVIKPEGVRNRGGVWFAKGAIQLHIGIEEPFIPSKKAHPAIEVAYINELKTHLTAHHINYIEDEQIENANRIFVDDPFGNRIEFIEWRK